MADSSGGQLKKEDALAVLVRARQQRSSSPEKTPEKKPSKASTAQRKVNALRMLRSLNNNIAQRSKTIAKNAAMQYSKAMNKVKSARTSTSDAPQSPGDDEDRGNATQFEPRLDFEILGVRTRDVTIAMSENINGRAREDDSFNLDGVGICIQKSERVGEVGVHVIEIHPTGTAAAGGNVYVGDVILEVNGKLMLYKDPADIVMEMVSSTEQINMKLAAARDLRVALFSGNDDDATDTSVDGAAPGVAYAGKNDSDATASILECLAQIGGNATVTGDGDGNGDNARLLDEWLQSTIATVEQRASLSDGEEEDNTRTSLPAGEAGSEASPPVANSDEVDSDPTDNSTDDGRANADDCDPESVDATEDPIDVAALDLLLTPKSVADQLSAKDAEMAQMKSEMEAMRQAQEQRTSDDAEFCALLARQREAERAEKLMAARRLQTIRDQIEALPPPQSRDDAVDHAVRESSLMEQVRLLESVINAPTAFPLTADEIAEQAPQPSDVATPEASARPVGSEAPDLTDAVDQIENSSVDASQSSTPQRAAETEIVDTPPEVVVSDDALASRKEVLHPDATAPTATLAACGSIVTPDGDSTQAHGIDAPPAVAVKPPPLDAGVVVAGSKFHKDCMGTYECAGVVNGRKFWELKNKETFLYFLERNWRVGKDTSSEKCILRTHSMAQRPDKAKSVWYEAQGVHSIMTGNPAIHVTRDMSNTSVGGTGTGSSGGPAESTISAAGGADTRARRKASVPSQQPADVDGKDTGKQKGAKRGARRKQDLSDATAKQEQLDRSQAIQAAKAEAAKRSRDMAAKRRASIAKDTAADSTAAPSTANVSRGSGDSGNSGDRAEDLGAPAIPAPDGGGTGPGDSHSSEGPSQSGSGPRDSSDGNATSTEAEPSQKDTIVAAGSAVIHQIPPMAENSSAPRDKENSEAGAPTAGGGVTVDVAGQGMVTDSSEDTATSLSSAQLPTAPEEDTNGGTEPETESMKELVEDSTRAGDSPDAGPTPESMSTAVDQHTPVQTLDGSVVIQAVSSDVVADQHPVPSAADPQPQAASADAEVGTPPQPVTETVPMLPKVEEWKSMNRFLLDKLESGHEVDVVSTGTNDLDGTIMAEPLTASSSDDPETAPSHQQSDSSATSTVDSEDSVEDLSDATHPDNTVDVSPDGLIVKTYHLQQEPGDHGFGFQILAPKHGEMGITMLKVHQGGAASRSGLAVGDVVVCIGKILVLYHHSLGAVSRAMASETTTDSRGHKQCQIICCTKYDLMEWLMSNQSTDALFQPSARYAQNRSSVSNQSTEDSVSCLSESDADVELAPFAKTVPSQIDLLDQVRSKMCGQLEQATELDLNDEECMVMSEEIARLGEQIEELEMRPRARLIKIRRCDAPDGRSLGFRFLMCPRANTVMVQHVEEGGAADAAGLKEGHYILEVSGRDTAKDTVEDVFKKLNDCGEVVELGTAPRARVAPLPHKARRLTAREQLDLLVDEFKAAPDLKSFFFGGRGAGGDRAGSIHVSPGRTASGSSQGRGENQSDAKQALRNAVQDAESRINDVKHKWRQIVVDEDGKRRMVYKSIGENSSRKPKVASNRELLFGCAIKRVSLRVKSVEAAGFGLRLKMSTTGKRLVEVESIDASSPLIAEDFEVEVGDVLLAVDDTLLCMDLASVSNANNLLMHAEVPCTLCFVAARWVSRLPDTDADRLRDLIKQTTLRGMWTQARKWYKEQEVREQQQPSIHAIAKMDVEARLPEDGPGKSLKLQTCTVCRTAKKEVVLGCGHSICNMCSKRTHMCPIRGCSRIIMSRKPIQHLFRSSMDEKMYRVGCATSRKGQRLGSNRGSSMDTIDMNPIDMTPHASEERTGDAGQGAIAGSWRVAKTLDFEEDGGDETGDGQKTTIVKKRKHTKKKRKETRVVDVVEYTRGHNALPAQRATFDDFTEV